MSQVPFKDRARKAVVAGWSAGITATLAAAGAALATEVPKTGAGWGALAGGALAAGAAAALVAARATYNSAANVNPAAVTYTRDDG